MGMGRQEASALVYRASAIGSGEAVENVKAVLAHWRKNGTIDLNRQTSPQSSSHPPQSSSQSLVASTSGSQNINAALSGFRKAFFDVASIKATGILQEILYRHHLAHLYDCYRNAEALLDRTRSSARGRGVGDASLRYFTKCLYKGHRYSGIFALIPTSKIPHSFMERLSSGIFDRFYPDAVKFGRLIEDFMQNALAGRQPPRGYLPIEDISDNQLQEMDLSDVLQLFNRHPALAIEDISSSPIP
ncbi:hypothetical protein V2W45_1440154 [Cenococcum geophilum]